MAGVTLDTNIYLSALEFGGIGARLMGMARAGAFRLDVSDAILDELVTVLRDDFNWDGYRLHFAREQIAKMANRVVPTQVVDVIKEDPDDNRILECAVAAGSDCIITYDKDLLRLVSTAVSRSSERWISFNRDKDFHCPLLIETQAIR